MADSFHFSVNIISRGKGKSAVASAAYISGEKNKKWMGRSNPWLHKKRNSKNKQKRYDLRNLRE